ncbi:MAG: hypothetical protein JSV70_08660 [bacterium]|nr:MAG: hypothetical protein JSV70_08660 [bacterium]
MRIRLFAAAFSVFYLASSAWCASEQGVTIRSESLVIEEKTGDIQFEGKVQVRMAEVVMGCDTLKVHTDEADPSRILRGEASGNIVLTRGNDRLEAGMAEFDLKSGMVELTGAPRLMREKTTIEAERIVYSLDEGTASFMGPVKALFGVEGDRP